MSPDSDSSAAGRAATGHDADPHQPSIGGARTLIAVGVLVVLVAAAWMVLPVERWLNEFAGWIGGFGSLSGALYVLVFAIGAVVLAPGGVLSMGAGLAFGLPGIVVAVIGATLGAAAAFLVSRHLARDYVRDRVRRHRYFDAADHAIGEQGWKVVLLMRLSPLIPYNFANYMFGATRVAFWPYVAATAVGVIPCTLMFVWIGAAGHTALDDGTSAGQWALLAGGLVATVAVTVLVTRAARRRLERAGVER